MKTTRTRNFIAAAIVGTLAFTTIARAADPLPSWNDGDTKAQIVDFVEPSERIAVFDNDGTLWAEQPMYFQAIFAFDRVKALAPQHRHKTEV